MEIRKSAAFDAFHCVAAACPDSCCQLWDVEVDHQAAAFYQTLATPLGDAIRENLYEEDGCTYFQVVQERCPMWRKDFLCRIQAELGHDALCRTCREFPRLTHDYGSFVEKGLELSCPEAARLMLNFDWDTVTETSTGEDCGDWDAEQMQILLESRQQALTMAKKLPPVQALAALLLFGYHTQAALEGVPMGEFHPENAMQTAMEFRGKGDLSQLKHFFSGLEVLNPAWPEKLSRLAHRAMDSRTGRLLEYFISRYWLQSISDGDLAARVKLMVVSCLFINSLDGDFVQNAQCYSKEIENSAENMDALLDGAYDAPELTDDKILGLLSDMT